jgi:hypothetical protein
MTFAAIPEGAHNQNGNQPEISESKPQDKSNDVLELETLGTNSLLPAVRGVRRKDDDFFKVRTLKDALESKSSAPPWIIQDLLLRDSATLISAHPHSMKSLSLLCACIEAVANKQVWGHFPAPTVERSLFIETEDPEWMVESRIRGLAKGLAIEGELPGFFYSCTGAFDLVATKHQIIELLEDFRPNFAVLSTLQGLLAGRDWLRQNDMADVNALCVDLARRYCPLIVVTHSPWSKKERRAAGTITQAANFVVNAHFQKIENKKHDSFVHVSVDSKAGAGETDFHLKLNTEGDRGDASAVRSLTFAGKGWPRGSQREAVLDALGNEPDASPQVIAQRVDCTPRYVQKIRKELAEMEEKTVRE